MSEKVRKTEEDDPFGEGKETTNHASDPVSTDQPAAQDAPQEQPVTQQMVPLDQVMALIDQKVEQARREMMSQAMPGRQVDQFGITPDQHNYRYNEFTVPDDDYLPPGEAVVFYCNRVGHVVLPDRRNGRISLPPIYRDSGIKFTLNHRYSVGHGKEADLFTVSSYECRSKMEAQWLREHTEYGTVFVEKFSSALKADLLEARNLYVHMSHLKDLPKTKLIDIARDEGVRVAMELDKVSIAAAIASKRAKVESDEGRKMLGEDAKRAAMAKNNPLAHPDSVNGREVHRAR